MKKLLPIAFLLAAGLAGAAIALPHTIHNAAPERAAQAAPSGGTSPVPGCERHKPLCDLLAY